MKINNVKVVQVHWFGGVDCIGVVHCYDPTTNENKCYIGVGQGFDENVDIYQIAKWGSKIPEEMAVSLFGEMENYA